jgi:hypothetical protein
MGSLVEDLASALARPDALVLVGAGVSVAATDGSPVASWAGLLRDGVDQCLKVVSSLPDNWGEMRHSMIDSGDSDSLLLVAEDISRRLGWPLGGDYSDGSGDRGHGNGAPGQAWERGKSCSADTKAETFQWNPMGSQSHPAKRTRSRN